REIIVKAFTKILVAAALALCAGSAAAEYAGVVKTAKGTATVDRAGTQIVLAPGVELNEGDRVITGADGYVGITMRDDTLLTLGPGSAPRPDAYGSGPKTHDGNFLAWLTTGVRSGDRG